jgi:ABC-type uncharacterized transport system substrate-binding protein
MRRNVISLTLCAMLYAPCPPAQAQQPAKIPRLGLLNSTSPSTSPARVEAFRQGLRDLGYVEGKDIVIEYRHAEGKLDRLPGLAAELVRSNVDIMVARGGEGARAAKNATKTILIIMVGVGSVLSKTKIAVVCPRTSKRTYQRFVICPAQVAPANSALC